MKYLTIISLALLLFTVVGWVIGYSATRTITVTDADLEVAVFVSPIAIGAALGLVVGLASAVLTVVSERRKND